MPAEPLSFTPPPSAAAADGRVLGDVANAVVALHHRYYGRGATRARAFWVHDDLLLCELRDVFLTVERTLIDRGQEDAVRQTRLTFQRAMEAEFIEAVEGLTGRRVQSYVSHSITHPECILEIFLLEPTAARGARLDREAAENRGEISRPRGGLARSDM